MKRKDTARLEEEKDNMLPDNDLSEKKGVRSRYYQAYRKGYAVRIREDNGTVIVRYFTKD
ncbi:MAG: hypothetical protein AB9866_16295 [Syntrophobacteraceae bacterium]